MNKLAKFDNKIELFGRKGFLIKQEMQRLLLQMGQKKNFIDEYFVTYEEYKEKKKVESKYD